MPTSFVPPLPYTPIITSTITPIPTNGTIITTTITASITTITTTTTVIKYRDKSGAAWVRLLHGWKEFILHPVEEGRV